MLSISARPFSAAQVPPQPTVGLSRKERLVLQEAPPVDVFERRTEVEPAQRKKSSLNKQPVKKSPTYVPKLKIGTYGPPKGHQYEDSFRTAQGRINRPAIVTVDSIRSLDPRTEDTRKAYANEVIVNLNKTKLAKKNTPGEHLTMLDISDPEVFSDKFRRKLRRGPVARLTANELKRLKNARLKNFTIASPAGGERDAQGNPTGKVRLIVRRVEKNGVKGPMTNYIAGLKPGDGLVVAGPISHHFLGPTAQTPAVFFGIGSSVAPYISMLKTRFEQEKGPYAETYLAIGHTRQDYEYDGDQFRQFAADPNHHFTYRPVFSQESDKSDGNRYVQNLIQNKDEARKMFALILNPKTRIYFSGFWEFDIQVCDALREATRRYPDLGVSEARLNKALETAKKEGRYNAEGEIRQDLAEGVQGY